MDSAELRPTHRWLEIILGSRQEECHQVAQLEPVTLFIHHLQQLVVLDSVTLCDETTQKVTIKDGRDDGTVENSSPIFFLNGPFNQTF